MLWYSSSSIQFNSYPARYPSAGFNIQKGTSMSFETHQTYHGFKCIHQENIKELNSVALQFEHEKTGAELLVM